MRTPALQLSLLAATLSPTLIQASPLPFSPRSEVVTSPRPSFSSGTYGRSVTVSPRRAPVRRALGLGFTDIDSRDAIISTPSDDGNLIVGSIGNGDKSFTGVGLFGGKQLLGLPDGDPSTSAPHGCGDSFSDPPADDPPPASDPEASLPPPNLDAAHPPPPDDCPCRNSPPPPAQDPTPQPPPPSEPAHNQGPDDENWPQAGGVHAAQPADQDGGCDEQPPDVADPEASQPPPDDVASPGGNLDAAQPTPDDGNSSDDCQDKDDSPPPQDDGVASPGGDLNAAHPTTDDDCQDQPDDTASPSPGNVAAAQPSPEGDMDDGAFDGQQGNNNLGLPGDDGGAPGDTNNESAAGASGKAANDHFHPLIDILSHDNDLLNLGGSQKTKSTSSSQGDGGHDGGLITALSDDHDLLNLGNPPTDKSIASSQGASQEDGKHNKGLIAGLSDDHDLLNLGGLLIRDSFTGASGSADGGSVHNVHGLVNILSNNAGDGGVTQSGDALSGTGEPCEPGSVPAATTSSYSGVSGSANGGSVSDDVEHSDFGGLDDLLNLGSNSGGNGGFSGTGSAGSNIPVPPTDVPDDNDPLSGAAYARSISSSAASGGFSSLRRSVLDIGLFGRRKFTGGPGPVKIGATEAEKNAAPSHTEASMNLNSPRARIRGSMPMGGWPR